MSIWRNCWTAVIFKSIVPPHATCELKRMCFPNDIQCLLLSCWFLGHYWNSFSVASWLIHHQQFRGTEDAKCWKWSMWACRTLWFWGSSQLDCLTYNPRKRDSCTLKGPSRLGLLWYFFIQLLLVTRTKSLTTGTLSRSAHLVTGLVKVVKSRSGSANLQQKLVFLSLEETSFAYTQ